MNSPPSRRDLELTHVFGSAFGLGDFLCEEDLFYNSLCSDLCDALRLNILEIRKHSFDPHGFTLLALLKESHMSFHTWPEHECVFFDLFTCSDLNRDVLSSLIRGRFHEACPSAVVELQYFDRSFNGLRELYF